MEKFVKESQTMPYTEAAEYHKNEVMKEIGKIRKKMGVKAVTKDEFIKKGQEAREKFDKAAKQQALTETYIKFEDCKPGYTYKIDARNFGHAIFYNDMFYGIRLKFHMKFIDAEIHWDKDDRHGTVKPQVIGEKTPDNVMEALKYYLDTRVDGGAQTVYKIVETYLENFIK